MRTSRHISAKLKILILLLLSLNLSSCFIKSEHPLGPLSEAITDNNLLGVWHAMNTEEPDRDAYLVVVKQDPQYFRIVEIGDYFMRESSGYITEVDGERYMNVPISNVITKKNFVPFFADSDDFKEQEEHFIFVHYSISQDGELDASFLNQDFFESAVQKGLLRGKMYAPAFFSNVKKGSVKLTATTEELVNFLRRQKKKDYLETPMRYRKMKK